MTKLGNQLTEVQIQALDLSRFNSLLDGAVIAGAAQSACVLLANRTVWNVNSTATGGGVAEMLQPLVGYARGAGIDARWLVISGDAYFFEITKRVHNGLHGNEGDRGPLGTFERGHYSTVLGFAAAKLRALVQPGDIVVLHDPQTAGLAATARKIGAVVIWRCHVGIDETNELVNRSWEFLRADLESVDACVFSRASYAPDWLRDRARVIAPSIDPFSTKNQDMDEPTVQAILRHVGIIHGGLGSGSASFIRRDGSPGRVDRVADLVGAGPCPVAEVPLVVQISRWDRLKDMAGVMQAFATHVVPTADAHLALVGPNVSGVIDDPEGAEVFNECMNEWRRLPPAGRARVRLACLPMRDIEENAAMVNALQRHAAVVVQKSLAEGFGLTVTEAMWKARPVVASRVGGIQDQIDHGEHGLLIPDATDLEACGTAICSILQDADLATRLGRNAKERVTANFHSTRHLSQYAQLFADLLDQEV